ncbi:hypothetical protein T4D_5666 [Trichinella pseudospiralis]|uniref:Uncharacterized protein n=1 Tax=Trichinella pseudospiralis TaxID=6337 RepID=A0A0V1G0R9_TRIPS|nr:hypothetical protein T4D_5666 [Trichinella pseudospiralis]
MIAMLQKKQGSARTSLRTRSCGSSGSWKRLGSTWNQRNLRSTRCEKTFSSPLVWRWTIDRLPSLGEGRQHSAEQL